MADFLTAFKITSNNEGGYVLDSNDSGGETYAGITRKGHEKWSGWTFIDEHKPVKWNTVFHELDGLVQTFYKANYWDPINGDSIIEQELANDAYDMAVNAGVGVAKQMLKSV